MHFTFHRHDLALSLKRTGVEKDLCDYAQELVDDCKVCQASRNAPYNPHVSDKMLDMNSYGRTNFVWLIDIFHYSLTERRGRDLTSVAITNQTSGRSVSYPRLNIHSQQETVRLAIFEAFTTFLGLPTYIYSDFGGELSYPTASFLQSHGVKMKPRVGYRFHRISQTDVSHRELRTLLFDINDTFKKFDIKPDIIQLHKLACLYYDARPRRKGDGRYLSNLNIHNLVNEVNPILTGTLIVNRNLPFDTLVELRNALYRKCVANTMTSVMLRIGSHKLVKLTVDPAKTKSGTKVLTWFNKMWRVSEFVGPTSGDKGLAIVVVFGTPKNIIVPFLRRCSQQLELDQQIFVDPKASRTDDDDAELILPEDIPLEEFHSDPIFPENPMDGDYIPPSEFSSDRSISLDNQGKIGPDNTITGNVVKDIPATRESSVMPIKGKANTNAKFLVPEPVGDPDWESEDSAMDLDDEYSDLFTPFNDQTMDDAPGGNSGTLDQPSTQASSSRRPTTNDWLLEELVKDEEQVKKQSIHQSKSNAQRSNNNTRRTRKQTKQKSRKERKKKSDKENAFMLQKICVPFYASPTSDNISSEALEVIKQSNGRSLYVDNNDMLVTDCPWPEYDTDIKKLQKYFAPIANTDEVENQRYHSAKPNKYPKSESGSLVDRFRQEVSDKVGSEVCFLTSEMSKGLQELQMAGLREFIRSKGHDELANRSHKLINRDPLVDKLNNALYGDKVILNNKNNKHLDRVIVEAKFIKDKKNHKYDKDKEYFVFDLNFTDIQQVFCYDDISKRFNSTITEGLYLVGCGVEIPSAFNFKKHLGDVKSSAIEVSEETFKRMNLINTFVPSNEKEIGDLLNYNTIHVKDHQTDIKPSHHMDSRVVYTIKINHRDGEISKCKTRIVVKGFQEFRQNLQRACYTVTDLGFNAILNHAVKNQYIPLNGDVTCAFLQGKEYDATKQVYIKLPQMVIDMNSNPLNKPYVKLRKSLYGLVDAPSEWQNALFEHLKMHGLEQCESDPALFRVSDRVLDLFFEENNESDLIDKKFKGASFQKVVSVQDDTAAADAAKLADSIKNDLNNECSSGDSTTSKLKSEAVMGVHVDDILASASPRAGTFLRCVFNKYDTSLDALNANIANRFLGRDLFCIANTSKNRKLSSTINPVFTVVDASGVEQSLEGDALELYLKKNPFIKDNIEFFLVTSMDAYQKLIKKLDVDEMNQYHGTLAKMKSRCHGNPYKLKFMTRQLHNPFRGRTGELGWLSKQKPSIMYDTTRFATYNMVSEEKYDSKFCEVIDELNEFITFVNSTTSNNCYYRMKDIPFVGDALSKQSHEVYENNIVMPPKTDTNRTVKSQDSTDIIKKERNIEVIKNADIKGLQFTIKPSHVCAVDAGIDDSTRAALGSCEAIMGSILSDDGEYVPLFCSADLDSQEKKTLDTSDNHKLLFSNLFNTRSSPKRIVRSSTGAELLGLKAGIHNTLYTRTILIFCGLIDSDSVSYILCDNKNLCHSNRKPPAEKLLLKDHLMVTKLIQKTNIKLLHIPGISNIADILTKTALKANSHLAVRYYTRGCLNQSLKQAFDPRHRGIEKYTMGDNDSKNCFLTQKTAYKKNELGKWTRVPWEFFDKEDRIRSFYSKQYGFLL